MGFKALAGVQRTPVQVPWANELVQSNPELVGTVYDVLSIKLKPKGMIIECSAFGGWYFKSSQEYKFLVPYLEEWYESKQLNPVMQIQLGDKPPYFTIGEDDERTTLTPWALEDTTFYQTVSKLKALPPAMNLSRPNVPSNSELPSSEQLDELAERKANQARQQTGKKKPPEEPSAPAASRK